MRQPPIFDLCGSFGKRHQSQFLNQVSIITCAIPFSFEIFCNPRLPIIQTQNVHEKGAGHGGRVVAYCCAWP